MRLDSKRTDNTRVLFCTTGIALRMMLCENPLEHVSHVSSRRALPLNLRGIAYTRLVRTSRARGAEERLLRRA